MPGLQYQGMVLTDWPSFLEVLEQAPKYAFIRTKIGSSEWESREKASLYHLLNAQNHLLNAQNHQACLQTSIEHFEKSIEATSLVEKDAIFLEQGFVAFSDQRPLNVENLISCIFLVIVDPNSNFCVGMHIDKNISKASIDKMIEGFLFGLGLPKEKHASYGLHVHMMGGDTSSHVLLKTIYTLLTQYSMRLVKLHLTIDSEDDLIRRPFNISYHPIKKTFYEAVVPLSNVIKRDSALYCHLYYDIHTLSECVLLKYPSKLCLDIAEIKKRVLMQSLVVIVLHHSTLYAFYKTENLVDEIDKRSSNAESYHRLVSEMQKMKDGCLRMATEKEMEQYVNILIFKKRSLRLIASDKEGLFRSYPFSYSEEERNKIKDIYLGDDCSLLILSEESMSPFDMKAEAVRELLQAFNGLISYRNTLIYFNGAKTSVISSDSPQAMIEIEKLFIDKVPNKPKKTTPYETQILADVSARAAMNMQRVLIHRYRSILSNPVFSQCRNYYTSEHINYYCIQYLQSPYTLVADGYSVRRNTFLKNCFFQAKSKDPNLAKSDTDSIVHLIDGYLDEYETQVNSP